MIVFFPEPYPDELVYSLLARYYVKAGYLAFQYAVEDLYIHKYTNPDVEFLNELKPEFLDVIKERCGMEALIQKHTMFPSYGRFLPAKRKQEAKKALLSMNGNFNNLLAIPKNQRGTGRFLRYCPLCAKEDREDYGEAYWHRIHQLQGVKICSQHRCYLVDSQVQISGKASPTLIAAETIIPEKYENLLLCQNDIEYQLADYVTVFFQSKLDLDSDITVGKFLHSRMENTPYRSVRGEQRNISLLHADFQEYYKKLPDNNFSELWQIQKVLTDDRINLYEVCMLAMFLNVSVADLARMKLPEQTQEQRFDEQIYLLHEQGLKYPEIARRLGASYDTVKAIGGQRYKKYHKESSKVLKCGIKAYDWQQIDKDTLPFVRDAIRRLLVNVPACL